MPTAYFNPPQCRRHEMGPGHPECPERLAAIDDWLIASGVEPALQHVEARPVDLKDVELAHTHGYVAEIGAILRDCEASGERRAVDPDTSANAHTWSAALHAAGAAVQATDLVIDGGADNAFCSVRPPGHHAERDTGMGFCVFSNVSLAADYALAKRGLKGVPTVGITTPDDLGAARELLSAGK